MPMWPFMGGQAVVGLKLFELVRWVCQSRKILSGAESSNGMPVITMPPVQRGSVWRPKQVLDLWDSMMRGLPIGVFYLVEACGGSRNVVLPDSRTGMVDYSGFDLLDGQQRMRALLVGALGISEEKRCLWVDLGASEAVQRPILRITSKAQPFGYDANTGNKLRSDERRKARKIIEPCPKHNPIRIGDGTQLRRAYDQELFDCRIDPQGQKIGQPPLPYHATPAQTFKLHELLGAWKSRSPHEAESGIDALRIVAGNTPTREALSTLHDAFSRVDQAQIALLRVDRRSFLDHDQDLLALYERIGAGGTLLSQEERLYSIYKYHIPHIRDAADAIHRKVGRVLPAIKIAATALRIANARANERTNWTPNVFTFAEEMRADPQSPLRRELARLIPTAAETEDGVLSRSFGTIKKLLSYCDDADAFWLPDVLLASLPAELWQSLVFWTVCRFPNSAQADLAPYREEVVRFALFWNLCVVNHEKAGRLAFAWIKEMDPRIREMGFPGAALYRRLTESSTGEFCAYALITPEEFESRLCKPPSAAWRTDTERFIENNRRNDIGELWWRSGRKTLPWLQRNYVVRICRGYTPLADHEDDLPYDVDHICPQKDWGDDWRYVQRRFRNVGEDLKSKMREGRWSVGNGIGNLRLTESSMNRHDRDVDISKKMPCAVSLGELLGECRAALADWAFPLEEEHREIWRRVSRPGQADRIWDCDRLSAFQQAVECRSSWLYRRFYEDLGYQFWLLS